MIARLRNAALSVGLIAAHSRVLGFVRDAWIAALLGAGPTADAFFVAFRLPDVMRRLFADGAFAAAVAPALAARLAQADAAEDPAAARRDAWAFAGRCLLLMTGLGTLLSAATLLAADAVTLALAPGFVDAPEQRRLAAALLAIQAPYAALLLAAAVYAAGLNALERFVAVAAAPVLLNLVMIAGCALIAARPDLAAPQTLAWAALTAGGAQLLLAAGAAHRAGARPRWGGWRIWRDPAVRQAAARLGPGVAAAGAGQAALLLGVMVASLGPVGTVAQLYLAERLAQLPQGLIGGALATSLTPHLARLGAQRAGNPAAGAEASTLINRALEMGLALATPAAAGLIALAPDIVAVTLERGAFDAAASSHAAAALAALAMGLPAAVLAKLLTPACFAAGRYRGPMGGGLGGAVVGAGVAWTLREHGAVGVAAGLSLAAWSNAGALAWIVLRARLWRPDRLLARRCLGFAFAALAMAMTARGAADLLAPTLGPVWALAATITLAVALYGATTWALTGLGLKALRRRGG